MSFHVPLLLLGLLLLWIPRQWLRLGKVVGGRRRRSGTTVEPWRTREPGDPQLSYHEFTKLRNYVDLLRGIAGGLAIVGGPMIEPALSANDALQRGAAKQVLVVVTAILLVGVLIQTIRYERHRIGFFAPVFFLAGLSVALCGPWPAVFAFALVWAVNPMFRNPEAFLSVYAVVLVAFGIMFHETPRTHPMIAFGLCFLPVLLSLLTRRPLVVFTRKAGSPAGG